MTQLNREVIRQHASSLPLSGEKRAALEEELRRRYTGVFDPEQIESHIVNQAEGEFAEYAVEVLSQVITTKSEHLDVGSGFGSVVTLLNSLGFPAVGIEIDEYDIQLSRRRFESLGLSGDPQAVFRCEDFLTAELGQKLFKCISMWNVAEHVESVETLLRKAYSMLERTGYLFFVCPNYASVRQEARYHIPWVPKFIEDRESLIQHFEVHGKDPHFYFSSIWPRTNEEVVSIAREIGFKIAPLYSMKTSPSNPPRPLSRIMSPFRYNSLTAGNRSSIELLSTKESAL